MVEPFGIVNTPIINMIDINEVGIKLDHNNQKHGNTPTILRVHDEGVNNQDEKIQLLLTIYGDKQYDHSWNEMWEGEGTTFASFLLYWPN